MTTSQINSFVVAVLLLRNTSKYFEVVIQQTTDQERHNRTCLVEKKGRRISKVRQPAKRKARESERERESGKNG